MFAVELKELFIRDLNQLVKELSSYSNTTQLYSVQGDIKNSGGNLALHICGNLKHFVGAVLNNTGYKRKRDLEFSDSSTQINDIIINVTETIEVINDYFESVQELDFDKQYPLKVFKKEMNTREMLLHLYGHLNYHLGQINYHRRLLNE